VAKLQRGVAAVCLQLQQTETGIEGYRRVEILVPREGVACAVVAESVAVVGAQVGDLVVGLVTQRRGVVAS